MDQLYYDFYESNLEIEELAHVSESALDIIYIRDLEGYSILEEAVKENNKSFFSGLRTAISKFITKIRAKIKNGNVDTTRMSDDQIEALKSVTVKVFDNEAYKKYYKEYSDALLETVKRICKNISSDDNSKDLIAKLSNEMKRSIKPLKKKGMKKKNFMTTMSAYDASKTADAKKASDSTINFVKETCDATLKSLEAIADKLSADKPEFKALNKFIRKQGTNFTRDTMWMISAIHRFYASVHLYLHPEKYGNTAIDKIWMDIQIKNASMNH